MSLPTPVAILFDWDNTLVDNWETIRTALNAARAAFGLEIWTEEETRQRVRQSMRDSFPEMFGEAWPEARRIFYEAFVADHLRTLRPLNGAGAFLARLGGTGLYLGVVSNKRGDLLRREAESLGWNAYFGRLVGAGDCAADKPASETVTAALADAPFGPSPKVWFVGDAAIDMECATRAGCTPILLDSGDESATALSLWPPKETVGSFDALAALVREGLQ